MRWVPGYILLIVLATWTVYWPVGGNGFVNFDDPHYVTHNPQVRAGLTPHGAIWAFTSATTGNWHPVTWLSHMADVQWFGLNPAAHHWTSVVLHTANALLLMTFLGMTTRAWGKSAFVAAVFAVHPLHVESVAWVSERKDVLSALFFFLALVAYARYVRRPQVWTYLAALLLFALALMCKPMAVTLPCVLLLADVWPLCRAGGAPLSVNAVLRIFPRLLLEKAPFLILGLALGVATIIVQARAESVRTLEQVGLGLRLENVLVSYVAYIGKTAFPARLAAYYPYPSGGIPLWKVFGASGLLVLATIAAVWQARRRPYIPAGWFWYLGTLVPVIGFIQVGSQAMADRYMYVPMVGLLVIVAWAVPELAARVRLSRLFPPLVAFGLCSILVWAARAQVKTWKNSFTLFEHALQVTKDNATAHNNLASAYLEVGNKDLDKAAEHAQAALRIDPNSDSAHNNLGVVYWRRHEVDKALDEFSVAVRIDPNKPGTDYNLGLALRAKGQLDAARTQFALALRLDPDYVDARFDLGDVLLRLGHPEEAAEQFRKVLQQQPQRVNAWMNLGVALSSQGRFNEAIPQFEQGLRLDPQHAEGRYYLALALASSGQTEAARGELETVLRQRPEYPEAQALLQQLTGTPPAG